MNKLMGFGIIGLLLAPLPAAHAAGEPVRVGVSNLSARPVLAAPLTFASRFARDT